MNKGCQAGELYGVMGAVERDGRAPTGWVEIGWPEWMGLTENDEEKDNPTAGNSSSKMEKPPTSGFN